MAQKPKDRNLVAYNLVKKIRKERMMTKAELARRSSLSINTIIRMENNLPCRIASKRKILLGLGYDITQKQKVFPEG